MRKTALLLLALVLVTQCKKEENHSLLALHRKFMNEVLTNDAFFYSIPKNYNTQDRNSRAIGIFDSGTGGLTVFDAILNADFYNAAHENRADGIKDFSHEQFIYLADQANMPYSNYVEAGNKELLVEHILKDALFLLNDQYHDPAKLPQTASDKPCIKIMVIACNTATAYGKKHIEELCQCTGVNIKIIGVIDAGCKGALDVIKAGENATIAVLATPATVGSKAYVNTLDIQKKGHGCTIEVIQQGGKGLHESIDQVPEFINAGRSKPYPEYQGPSLHHDQYKIDKQLLPYYKFDTAHHHMLYNRQDLVLSDTIQINSIDNYARYHITSLLEQLKKENHMAPLKAIILGCTHYPYAAGMINKVLAELKQTERYKNALADSIYLIDPALTVAKELYTYLSTQNLFNTAEKERSQESRFFISVPNTFLPGVETDGHGRFTYDYQYRQRKINELKDYTLLVPLSPGLLSEEQKRTIQQRIPVTCKILEQACR